MDKTLQLIGLSKRARHLITGTDSVINALQNNKLHLIFVASDASANLIDKIEKKAFYYNVIICKKYNSNELSQMISKDVVVIGIDDEGLANAMKKELENINESVKED